MLRVFNGNLSFSNTTIKLTNITPREIDEVKFHPWTTDSDTGWGERVTKIILEAEK